MLVQLWLVTLFWWGVPTWFHLWALNGLDNAWSLHCERAHLSRPSFAAWVDKQGKLRVRAGDNPDHSTRCQRSLQMYHDRRQKLGFTAGLLVCRWLVPASLFSLVAWWFAR